MRRVATITWALGLGLASAACAPGYMNARELERKEQGPTHCASRCHELGMEMGALVLVSDSLPGCVCQPRGTRSAAVNEGASAATTGYVVLAAAAAAAHQQQQRQQQQRQQQQQQQQRSSATY